MLAESCKLDEFLAYAELYMIKHTGVGFWQETMRRISISISCILRVLRGGSHFRQKIINLLQNQQNTAITSCIRSRRYSGSSCQCMTMGQAIMAGVQKHDVTVEMLMQWHKEGA